MLEAHPPADESERIEAEALAQLAAIRHTALHADDAPSRAVLSTGFVLGAMVAAMLVLALLVNGGAA
jgi:hypothetical protein